MKYREISDRGREGGVREKERGKEKEGRGVMERGEREKEEQS